MILRVSGIELFITEPRNDFEWTILRVTCVDGRVEVEQSSVKTINERLCRTCSRKSCFVFCGGDCEREDKND